MCCSKCILIFPYILQTIPPGQVLSRGLFIEEIEFLEPSNFWFGPRPADLIHLGAKFSPCMRPDLAIREEVLAAREQVAKRELFIRVNFVYE